jgi:LytS/YehU family sensor histidine kinase
VQSGNEEGTWNTTAASMHFVINPAFWQTTWFKIAVALLVVTVAFFFIQRRIRSIRKESAMNQLMAETEMKALRAQMNPHFIFNCMATADGFILQNRKLEASEFLNKFSRLIRMVLENSQHSLVPVQKDLEALKIYIQLEQIRHQNKFVYCIDIDPELEQENICIPPLLLQPYVENAIIHGLRHKTDNDGALTVTAELNNDQLNFIIDDNGIGRDQSAVINQNRITSHQSMGMNVTSNRIETIQFIYKKKATVLITDKVNNSGTEVRITVPVFKDST